VRTWRFRSCSCSLHSLKAYNQCKVTDYSNPLRGVVPKVVHKDDVDEAALVELIEKLPGEVAFDAYVKAVVRQNSARL